MDELINQSIFFVLDAQGKPCGAGFVLELKDNGHVAVTCAHVIAEAGVKPGNSVKLLFRYAGDLIELPANVLEKGFSPAANIAFIDLPESTFTYSPLRLWSPINPHSELLVIEYLVQQNQGNDLIDVVAVSCVGEISTSNGFPLLHIKFPDSKKPISGSIILTKDSKYAIGMVSGKLSGENEIVLAIPATTIHDLYPEVIFESEDKIERQKQARGYFFEAQLAAFTGEFEESERLCEKALVLGLPEEMIAEINDFKQQNQWLSTAFREAKLAEQAGDLEEAIRIYKEIISRSPHDIPARYRLGQAIEKLNQIEHLIKKAKEAEHEGHFDEAIRMYEVVISQAPDNIIARSQMESAHNQIKQIENLTRKAADAEQAGRFDEAILLYGEIISRTSDNIIARSRLESAHRQLKQIENLTQKAADAYQEGRLDEAIRMCEEVISRAPDNISARSLLNNAKLKLDDKKQYSNAESEIYASSLHQQEQILLGEIEKRIQLENQLRGHLEATLNERIDLEDRIVMELNRRAQQEAKVSKHLEAALKAHITAEEKALKEAELSERLEEILKARIDAEEKALEALQRKTKAEGEKTGMDQNQNGTETVDVSLAHPKLLSKRFTSPILVYIHPKRLAPLATVEISKELTHIDIKEETYRTESESTEICVGATVMVKIECPGIEFLSATTVKIADDLTKISFLVKPSDTCEVGKHVAKLSICDGDTGQELYKLLFRVQVVDFVTDHISRPFVLKLAAAFSGLGAMIMFILTFFGEVDTTFGLASGTTIGAVAVALYFQFNSLFQRLNKISGTP